MLVWGAGWRLVPRREGASTTANVVRTVAYHPPSPAATPLPLPPALVVPHKCVIGLASPGDPCRQLGGLSWNLAARGFVGGRGMDVADLPHGGGFHPSAGSFRRIPGRSMGKKWLKRTDWGQGPISLTEARGHGARLRFAVHGLRPIALPLFRSLRGPVAP